MSEPIKKKTIEIVLDDQTITVQKLPLKKYADLLSILDEIPKQFESFDQLQQDKMIQSIPKILKNALPEALNVMAVFTGIPKEEIGELGMHELVRLFAGVLEANKYDEVFDVVKKIFAQSKVSTLV